MQNDIFFQFFAGQFKGFFERTYRIVMILDRWRSLLMGIFHIGIDRDIIANHFPLGRNVNQIPVPNIVIILKKVIWPFRRVDRQVKFPFSVKGSEDIRIKYISSHLSSIFAEGNKPSSWYFLVNVIYSGIFPFGMLSLNPGFILIFRILTTGG